MRVFSHLCSVVVLVALGVWPVSAQSTYVSAAIVGDVLRSTHAETALGPDISQGGEAVGFALRVGTPLGSRWGVELEFTRGGEIDFDFSGAIPLASRVDAITWSSLVPGSPMPQLLSRPVSLSLRSARRHNTLSTTVWMNQELSQRVSLVYLAGMGFYRNTFESEARFGILPPELSIPGLISDALEDGQLWRAAARGVRGPHRPDRSRRARAGRATARARQRLAGTSRRRSRVEVLTTRRSR